MEQRLEQQVEGKIKRLAKNPIRKKNLYEKLMEEFGLSRDQAESKVQDLIMQGTLFEPDPGKIKMLRA